MYIRSDLNWGIGLILLGAIVSSASALVRESASLNVAIVGLVVNLIGAYYWLKGCFCLAQSKGYHPAWGVALGLFVITYVMLLSLPDKTKQSSQG